MAKQYIFTAGTGRAGTTTIVDFFRENIRDCVALHEPPVRPQTRLAKLRQFLAKGYILTLEDKGFGKALLWNDFDDRRLLKIVDRNLKRIQSEECTIYFEANHAFIKTFCDHYIRFIPEMKVIHLYRDPFEVAKSLTNRVTYMKKNFVAYNFLPDFRKNCVQIDANNLSQFQLYFWNWLEVELRVVRFLEQNRKIRVFHLQTHDLNNPEKMQQLVDEFDLPLKGGDINIPPAKNANPLKTVIDEKDREEAAFVVRKVGKENIARLTNSFDLLSLASSPMNCE